MPTVGGNCEVLRSFAKTRDNFNQRELTRLPNPVSRNAVVTTVGSIEEFAIRSDFHIRGVSACLGTFG